jgi:hypothetical protein
LAPGSRIVMSRLSRGTRRLRRIGHRPRCFVAWAPVLRLSVQQPSTREAARRDQKNVTRQKRPIRGDWGAAQARASGRQRPCRHLPGQPYLAASWLKRPPSSLPAATGGNPWRSQSAAAPIETRRAARPNAARSRSPCARPKPSGGSRSGPAGGCLANGRDRSGRPVPAAAAVAPVRARQGTTGGPANLRTPSARTGAFGANAPVALCKGPARGLDPAVPRPGTASDCRASRTPAFRSGPPCRAASRHASPGHAQSPAVFRCAARPPTARGFPAAVAPCLVRVDDGACYMPPRLRTTTAPVAESAHAAQVFRPAAVRAVTP